MQSIVEQLQQLGFSQYEAQAYITLLQHNPLTGYEIAKSSGVPRANIYGVLQKLEERGAVLRLDSEDGVRYSPVPAEEFIGRLESQFQQTLGAARKALNAINTQVPPEPVWNLQGYNAILEHAQSLIDSAEHEVLVAFWPPEAHILSASLQQAARRGLQLTILCAAGCTQVCSSCCGNVFRYPVPLDEVERWLILVPDSSQVLSGEIRANGDSVAVRTRQRLQVELARGFIHHRLALRAMQEEAGSLSESLLTPRLRAILRSLNTSEVGGEILAYLPSNAGDLAADQI